jgi:membrane protein implicated in regulation of membrane protease activity
MLMAVGVGFGEQAADTDVGTDADVAADADLDAGADVDVDADTDVSLEHGGDFAHGDVGHGELAHGAGGHEVHASALGAFVGFLGIGKVPLSILMMSYCFVWGVAGLVSVTLLGKEPLWPAVAIAAGAAVLITRQLAAGLSRLIPSVESYHTPQRQLVGLRGDVLYEVTDSSGVVRVHGPQDTLRDVSCRVVPGAKNIPAGTSVVLLRYDAATGVFYVEA